MILTERAAGERALLEARAETERVKNDALRVLEARLAEVERDAERAQQEAENFVSMLRLESEAALDRARSEAARRLDAAMAEADMDFAEQAKRAADAEASVERVGPARCSFALLLCDQLASSPRFVHTA